MDKIKHSRSHFIDKDMGYSYTDMENGRAKVERRHGVQPWKKFRTCACKGGRHQGLPSNDYCQQVELFDKKGFPKSKPTWTTECPVTCHETVKMFHIRSHNFGDCGERLYAKWSETTHRLTRDDYGRKLMYPFIKEWLKFQGVTPGDWHRNGGRKASGQLCDEYAVPYEHSMDNHAAYSKNWARYQPNVRRPPNFTRRQQSQRDLDCCVMHDIIYAAWGRGRLAGKLPPPTPPSKRVPKLEGPKPEKRFKKEEEKTDHPPVTIDLTEMQVNMSRTMTHVRELKSGMDDIQRMLALVLEQQRKK